MDALDNLVTYLKQNKNIRKKVLKHFVKIDLRQTSNP